MKAYFLDLFAFDIWANQRVLSEVVRQDVKDEKIHHWLNHIINAEKIWFERLQKGTLQTMPWDEYPLSSLYSRMAAVHQELLNWLNALTEEELLQGVASYQDTKGQAFQTAWIPILTHIVNHSTHHRAQIVARMREQGHVPPATDYIFFVREKKKDERI